MRVTEVSRTLIHTRYHTDGERLLPAAVHQLERELTATLRGLRLWADARVDHGDSVTVTITCQPGGSDADAIRARLDELLDPLPIRPVSRVTVEPRGPYR